MEEKLLVDVAAASRLLGLSRSFTYSRLIQTGRLRSYKIGGARRVIVEDLHEFIRRLKEESEEAAHG